MWGYQFKSDRVFFMFDKLYDLLVSVVEHIDSTD